MRRKDIKVRQLASGDQLSIPVYEFQGTDKNAPEVFIPCNVHGAEVQGNIVAFELMKYFVKHPPKGKITIVPKANPYGLNTKMGEYTFGRFDPINGKNYNRTYVDIKLDLENFVLRNNDKNEAQMTAAFKEALCDKLEEIENNIPEFGMDYANYLSLKIQQLAQTADILLDLHTASNSVPHLYTPAYTFPDAEYLKIENVIRTQDYFAGALEEAVFVPWRKLQDYLKNNFKTDFEITVQAYTVECGSQEKASEEQAKLMANNILNFLTYKGVIAGETSKKLTAYHVRDVTDYRCIYSDFGGIVSYLVKPGEKIEKGQHIANIYQFDRVKDKETLESCCKPFHSPYNGVVINLTDSAVVHQHMEMARILLK